MRKILGVAAVTKIVNAPPMIEIFFRKLLCWPICCGPAAHRADA